MSGNLESETIIREREYILLMKELKDSLLEKENDVKKTSNKIL